MDIKKILKENRQQMTIWINFQDIFKLELIYTDRQELMRMLERCKRRVWENHRQVENFNDDRFNGELAAKIADWRGLTLSKLADLTNIELDGSDPDIPIPCTEENKVALMEEIYGLNSFVRDTIMDIQLFRQKMLESEVKNSSTSQGEPTG